MRRRLEITTMVGCPLMCTYCPQELVRREYGKETKYLQVEDFVGVINRLPMDVRIDFSGMSEPWANPRMTDLLRHALSSGRQVAVYTTLYGMTETQCEEAIGLLAKHADRVAIVCLHLPDAQGNMRGSRIDDLFMSNLASFLELGERKLFKFEALAMGELHPSLPKYRLRSFKGVDRAGTVNRDAIVGKIERPVYLSGPIGCDKYEQNVLMPNGDVYLCCMDYGLKHRLGNLFRQGYGEILEASATIAAANLQTDSGTICRRCSRARAV